MRKTERPLRERQLPTLLRRQFVRPCAHDLRPVERTVRTFPLHHHGEVVVDVVVPVVERLERHRRRGRIVVGDREELEAAVEVRVQHPLVLAVSVRGGVHLLHFRPVDVRIRTPVARRHVLHQAAGTAALHMGSRHLGGFIIPCRRQCGRRSGQTDEVSAFHAASIPFPAPRWQ